MHDMDALGWTKIGKLNPVYAIRFIRFIAKHKAQPVLRVTLDGEVLTKPDKTPEENDLVRAVLADWNR